MSNAPTPGTVADLGPDADPESVARTICLRQLTDGPRTRAQLAETLRRRAVPQEAAERVLCRFEDVGLVDDAAFARAWVESRQRSRGLARRALGDELRRKGVDDEEVEAALAEVDPQDEEDAARQLVRRRLAATAGLPRDVRLRRLSSMLARKGYSGSVALRVVRDELAASSAREPD